MARVHSWQARCIGTESGFGIARCERLICYAFWIIQKQNKCLLMAEPDCDRLFAR